MADECMAQVMDARARTPAQRLEPGATEHANQNLVCLAPAIFAAPRFVPEERRSIGRRTASSTSGLEIFSECGDDTGIQGYTP